MKTPAGWLVAAVQLPSAASGHAFEPFFDDNPATRHAPPDPELTDLDLDVRLLIAGTLAFKQANRRVTPNATEACLFETRVDGVDPYIGTPVIRSRALRTFYPLADERPYCRRDRDDWRACLCSRLNQGT